RHLAQQLDDVLRVEADGDRVTVELGLDLPRGPRWRSGLSLVMVTSSRVAATLTPRVSDDISWARRSGSTNRARSTVIRSRRWHRAPGCERGVRVRVVCFHAPATGHPAISRGQSAVPGATRGRGRAPRAA